MRRADEAGDDRATRSALRRADLPVHTLRLRRELPEGALKRFQAKHALGLDPGVDTGSREENASKPDQVTARQLLPASAPAPRLAARSSSLDQY